MVEGTETIPIKADPNSRSCPGDVEIPNRVFVKGFPKETTEEELKEFFEIYGIVHDAKIIRSFGGGNKGFAFVTFDSQEIAEKIKEMAVIVYKDRDMVVASAKIRKRRPVFYQQQQPNPEQYWIIPQDQTSPYYMAPDGTCYYQPAYHQAVPVMATSNRGSHFQIEQTPYYDYQPHHQQPQQPQQQPQQYYYPASTTYQAAYSPQTSPTPSTTVPQHTVHLQQQQQRPATVSPPVQQEMKTGMQPVVPTMATYTPGYPVYVNAITDGMSNMILSEQQYVTVQQQQTIHHEMKTSPPAVQPPVQTCNPTIMPAMTCNSHCLPVQSPAHCVPVQSPPHCVPVQYEGYIHREEHKMSCSKGNEAMVPNILYMDASMKAVKMLNQEHTVTSHVQAV